MREIKGAAVPGLRRMGPVHPGLRVELGATTLIVNRGLGVIGVPVRVGAPAEIVFVRLEAVAEDASAHTMGQIAIERAPNGIAGAHSRRPVETHRP